MVIQTLVERKNIQKIDIGRKVVLKDVIIARSISTCVPVNLSLIDQSVTMVLLDKFLSKKFRRHMHIEVEELLKSFKLLRISTVELL